MGENPIDNAITEIRGALAPYLENLDPTNPAQCNQAETFIARLRAAASEIEASIKRK